MNILTKILLVFSFFFLSFFKAQSFSKGILSIDSEKIPIKIFSSPRMIEISEVLAKENNILIITNKYNTEANSQQESQFLNSYYSDFQSKKYFFLNSDFQLVEIPLNGKTQYILKTDKKIFGKNLDLQTSFRIWNPDEGLDIFGFKLRYYGLMFVFAFGLGLLIMRRIFKIDGVDEKFLDPLFTYTLLGTIFGARIGHVLFYEPHLFKEDFWSVLLPIRTNPTFEFTGFSGLASHGAAISLLLTTLYYSIKIIKKNPLWVYDRLGIVIALAGFFIRIGNFFNSEIIGKPTPPNSFFGVYFPQQSLDYGVIVPRYPTQLIEAFGYLSLFVLLWVLYKFTDKKQKQGWLFGVFLSLLWLIRFFAEYLKEPQGEEYISFLGLNTGQILSLPFILIGIACIFYSKRNRI